MAVVPAYELGCGVAAGQVFIRHPEAPIRLGPAGEQDRVVCGWQLLQAHVSSYRDIPQEGEARRLRNLVVDQRGLFEFGMMGSDAVANQTEGYGQPLDHVDSHCER